MSRIVAFFSILVLIGLSACKGKDPDPTPTDTSTEATLLKTTTWSLDRVTTPDGQAVTKTRLNLTTQLIFDVDIQFKDPDITRALDHVSKQVLNGGTWYLRDENKSIDVDVTGFKGLFKIISISRTALVLQQSDVPIDGVKQPANLNFVAL